MRTFQISESKWWRGQGQKDSKLLREDGKMCCIGMVCEQLGIPREWILNKGGVVLPMETSANTEDAFLSGDRDFWVSNEMLWALYLINDLYRDIGDEERIERLNRTLEKHGANWLMELVP